MINNYLGLVIIFAVQHQVSLLSVDVPHRLAHRKDKIKRLQDIQKTSEALQYPIENYDLMVTEPSDTTLITPTLRHRHHHHHRHRSGKGANVTITNDNPHIPLKDANILRKNFNVTGETNKTVQEDKAAKTANNLIENQERREEKVATTQIQEQRVATSHKPVLKNQSVTPVVPFYRRINYLNDQERNKPQKWVHCLDLISPRLKGYADDSRLKQITSHHSTIKRLVELLTVDVSKYTEEEIVSVLYQISNLDLKIFQWDYTALTTILNVIIKGSKHNFKTLKSGVKYLFEKWHLDTSSLKTFLDQTRIFRPPCIDISGYDGFTKKAGGVALYTKPDKPTKKPRGAHESCQSRENSAVNNNNDR